MADTTGCEVMVQANSGSGTYYTDCDNLDDLSLMLENTGNSNITLYKSKNASYNTFNPYIVISPYRLPRYYPSQNSSYTELSIYKVSFSPLGNFYHYRSYLDTGMIFSIFIIMLLQLIKK